MEFEIDQARLLSALTLAQTVADRRSTMPVLANVLLRVTADDELVCSATDMMIALTETVPCKVTSPGSLTLGVRYLHNVVRTLPAGAIKINALDNSWARIVASRSEFKLMGMPEGDFPELPDPEGVSFTELPGHKLVDLIEKTLFSVSTDEARVNLNGALFECDGKTATMVSTDGHRLTKFEHALCEVPALEQRRHRAAQGHGGDAQACIDRADGDDGASGYRRRPTSFCVKADDARLLSIKLNAGRRFRPTQQVMPKDLAPTSSRRGPWTSSSGGAAPGGGHGARKDRHRQVCSSTRARPCG